MRGYEIPELPEGTKVSNLVPEGASANELRPETVVLCINRGRRPLYEKFDGTDWPIPTGYFHCRYDQARHFRRRLIVPGTRDAATREINGLGGFVSFIGILNVDRPEDCEPFTDDELERMNEAVEGLDRGGMFGSDAAVKAMPLRGRAPSRSESGMRPQIDTRQQASSEAAERAAEAFTPPATSLAERDEREAGRADRQAEPAARASTPAGKRSMKDVRNRIEAE